MLVRRPSNGFYCCKMLRVLLDRTQAGVIPDQELAERKDVTKPVLVTCPQHLQAALGP